MDNRSSCFAIYKVDSIDAIYLVDCKARGAGPPVPRREDCRLQIAKHVRESHLAILVRSKEELNISKEN